MMMKEFIDRLNNFAEVKLIGEYKVRALRMQEGDLE